LEAIFLLTGMSNPQLAVNIHSFRDLGLNDDEGFSYLFKNLELTKKPFIKGQLNAQERFLTIEIIRPVFSGISEQISEKHKSSNGSFISNTSTTSSESIEGLRFVFSINNEEKFQTELQLKQNSIKFSGNYKEKLSSSFINPKIIMHDIDRRLDTILVKKGLDTIINALKEIEPSLLDIRMGTKGMIYADIGLDKLIPINLMGDGIRRILGILATIYERRNGILLIDEIENGLHYSTLAVLWKAILKAVLDNNVQLFATTHSYECVQAMITAYQSSSADKNFISLFRIEKDKNNKHHAFQYDLDTLIAGIEKGFEVR